MAAKRIGEILTNVQGTADQILRVKSDESGFEFYTQQALPTYTLSNVTLDREINALSTGLDELSDVIGTLINDLKKVMNGPESITTFQWSSSEQVWPFQTGPSGETCYAKRLSATVTGMSFSVSHNISSLKQLIRCTGIAFDASAGPVPLPFGHPAGLSWHIGMEPSSTDITVTFGSSWSAYGAVGSTITYYLIYTKN